jgi:tetratricopeptide (TPR) repeat protein
MARFADDLRAVLARQPVAARRPTGLLRTLRYLQRHPVRALTTALLLLSALLPAALWWQERAARAAIQAQVVRAERAEQRSRADAASAWELVEFLENIFRDATPDYGEGRSASLRDALERGVREIRFGAHRDPALRARLLEAMARACLHTGWFSEAAALTDEADNLIGQLPAVDDGERRQRLWHRAQVRLVQRRYAEHSALLAALLADGPLSDPVLWASACVAQGTEQARQDQLAAARRSLVAGVAAMRRNVVAGDPRLASPLLELATLLQRVEGRAAAEPLVQEASALVEPLPLGHPTRFSTVCRVTWFHENWGEHRTALRMARDGLTAAESYGVAPRHPLRGVLHRIAARQALYLDDMSAALSHAESAVDLLRGASRGSDHDLVRAISTAASAALALGDVARARGHVDEALQLGAVLPEPDPGLLATVHATRASVLVEEGDAQVALAAIEQSQALGCQAPTLPPAFGVTTSVNLARAQVRTGRKDLARETLRSVVAALNAPDLPQAWTMGLWLAQVAWLHTQLGDVDQGEQYARRALDVLGRCEASVSRPAAVAWKHLGYAQLQKRELRAAAASLERSLELHRQLLPQDKWFNVLDLLTNAYMWSNQNAQAEATLLLALSLGESASGRGFGSNDRRASLARVRCVLGRRTEAAADIDVVLDGFLTSAPPTREAAQYAIETALRIADGHDDPDVRTQRLVRLATVASRVLPSEHVLCGRIRAALDRRSGG